MVLHNRTSINDLKNLNDIENFEQSDYEQHKGGISHENNLNLNNFIKPPFHPKSPGYSVLPSYYQQNQEQILKAIKMLNNGK